MQSVHQFVLPNQWLCLICKTKLTSAVILGSMVSGMHPINEDIIRSFRMIPNLAEKV